MMMNIMEYYRTTQCTPYNLNFSHLRIKLMFLCSRRGRRSSKHCYRLHPLWSRWPTWDKLFLVVLWRLVSDELIGHVTRVSADDRHSGDLDSRTGLQQAGRRRCNTKARCRCVVVGAVLMTNYELVTSPTHC